MSDINERSWHFLKMEVKLIDDEIYIWFYGVDGSNCPTRVVHLPATEERIRQLDRGGNPVSLHWEIRPGVEITPTLGIGWFDEYDCMAEAAILIIEDGKMRIKWLRYSTDDDCAALRSWASWNPIERKKNRVAYGHIKDIGYWSITDGFDIIEDSRKEVDVYFEYCGQVYYVTSVFDDDPYVSLNYYDSAYDTVFSLIREVKILGVNLDREFPTAKFVQTMEDIGYGPNEVECTKMITQNGTSLTISITKEARILGLEKGDYVDVKLSTR